MISIACVVRRFAAAALFVAVVLLPASQAAEVERPSEALLKQLAAEQLLAEVLGKDATAKNLRFTSTADSCSTAFLIEYRLFIPQPEGRPPHALRFLVERKDADGALLMSDDRGRARAYFRGERCWLPSPVDQGGSRTSPAQAYFRIEHPDQFGGPCILSGLVAGRPALRIQIDLRPIVEQLVRESDRVWRNAPRRTWQLAKKNGSTFEFELARGPDAVVCPIRRLKCLNSAGAGCELTILWTAPSPATLLDFRLARLPDFRPASPEETLLRLGVVETAAPFAAPPAEQAALEEAIVDCATAAAGRRLLRCVDGLKGASLGNGRLGEAVAAASAEVHKTVCCAAAQASSRRTDLEEAGYDRRRAWLLARLRYGPEAAFEAVRRLESIACDSGESLFVRWGALTVLGDLGCDDPERTLAAIERSMPAEGEFLSGVLTGARLRLGVAQWRDAAALRGALESTDDEARPDMSFQSLTFADSAGPAAPLLRKWIRKAVEDSDDCARPMLAASLPEGRAELLAILEAGPRETEPLLRALAPYCLPGTPDSERFTRLAAGIAFDPKRSEAERRWACGFSRHHADADFLRAWREHAVAASDPFWLDTLGWRFDRLDEVDLLAEQVAAATRDGGFERRMLAALILEHHFPPRLPEKSPHWDALVERTLDDPDVDIRTAGAVVLKTAVARGQHLWARRFTGKLLQVAQRAESTLVFAQAIHLVGMLANVELKFPRDFLGGPDHSPAQAAWWKEHRDELLKQARAAAAR